MEKLPRCRICLVENVRMHIVAGRNMHELYESLTDIPFATEDTRPMLACYFCYAKLEQCCQLQRQCLKAEELFAQMMNEPNPVINQGQLQCFNGYGKSPIDTINIAGVDQMESIAIKEELPAFCERPHDIIEPKEEHQSYELDNGDNYCSDIEDTPVHHSESDLDTMKLKSEVEEEQQVLGQKRKASDTRRAIAAKQPKEDIRRIKLEDEITEEQKDNEKSDVEVIKTTENRMIEITFKEPHKCDECQCNFGNKSDLHKHFRTHTGGKPFKCDICQRSFSYKSHLTDHIRTHTGEKPYKCDICQRCFSQNSGLHKHIRSHSGEKPYICEICQRSFSQKFHLTVHIRTHTGVTPYKCDICQRSFGDRSAFNYHIRTHTGQKPYKCEICQRSFSQKSHLTDHIRTHTGEKPYKCDICQCSFRQKSRLTIHIRTHTGQKPHKCDTCQRNFSSNGDLGS